MYKKIISILLLLVLLTSCDKTTPKNEIIFSGKIENPYSNFIIFCSSTNVKDTIYLKKDNSFHKKIKNIKTGTYYFEHGPEYQFIFAKPKDSIFISLDTQNFDKTLLFSGDSYIENNFLAETILKNFKDSDYFSSIFGKKYDYFKTKIDSVKNIKKSILDEFKRKNPNVSPKFIEVLEISLMYNIFRQTELYYTERLKKDNEIKHIEYKRLLENRKNIDLNKNEYLFFYPYERTVYDVINTDTYIRGYKKYTDNFTASFINNLDMIIKDKTFKNNTSLIFVRTFLNVKSSTENCNKTINTFKFVNTDLKDNEHIKNLASDINSLKKNADLPNFKITDNKGNIIHIKELIKNKKAVLFFYNIEFLSEKIIREVATPLAKKYKNLNFYIINSSPYTKYKDGDKQYYLPKNSTAHKFLKSRNHRVLLINKNKITTDFITPFSADFKQRLDELSKM